MRIVTKEWIIIVLLIILTLPLRFINLGYSDYVKDEHRTFFDHRVTVSPVQFFISQRKGPMQVFVSYIPYLFTHDFHNELAERIPYALINIASVVFFYLMISKLTKNRMIGFISALLYLVNGFVSAFGRIVQYQNLNLIFTFLSLYLYSDLLDIKDRKKTFFKTLLGTFFYCLSILSHWDAVFAVLPIAIILAQFLFNKRHETKYKIQVLVINFLLGCLLLLPYLIPYILYQLESSDNQRYLFRRVGVGEKDHSIRTLIELYHPFVFYWFLIIGTAIGGIFIKKNYYFLSWAVFTYLVFNFFVIKPGTHIYNFVIPALVVCAIGIERILCYSPKLIRGVIILSFLALFSFFYYQTYILFVDHTVEYPWRQEKILGKYETINYEDYPVLPLFGFPLRRDWDQINEFVNEQNRINNENLKYITNEDASTSNFYMDASYGTSTPAYYYIAVKQPLSFVNDWKAPQIKNKRTVKEIEINGETVVRIYRVENP